MDSKDAENFLLINKPAGWTSFDVVAFLRNKYREAHPEIKKIRVGHAGTLDPFATGLLVVAVGREATRRLDEFKKLKKTYLATLRLGAVSDTFDPEGKIEETSPEKKPSLKQIKTALKKFTGPQLQTPPMFSAKKIAGQKLYDLARQGKTVEREPAKIGIYKIKLLEYSWPTLKIEVTCSPGTYIRSLAHDLGHELGTGAYCQELTRTAIGPYTLEGAVNPQAVKF